MAASPIYVPILKLKAGELEALLNASREVSAAILPLVELAPKESIGWPSAEKQSRDLLGHWGTTRRILIDSTMLSLAGSTSRREHPLWCAVSQFRERGTAVPVVRLDHDSFTESVALDLNATDRNGLCLRLRDEDLADDVQTVLLTWLDRMSVSPGEVDLVVDLGVTDPSNEQRTRRAARSVLMELPHPADWRTLTLAGTAFPESTGVRTKDDAVLPRTEWNIWSVIAADTKLPRCPIFGDYGISHVDFLIPGETPFQIPVQGRYTTHDGWLVRKEGTWQDTPESAADLARWIVERAEFSGEDFSWGDGQIADIAAGRLLTKRGKGSMGSATKWRAYGTSHHLALVVDQIQGSDEGSNHGGA